MSDLHEYWNRLRNRIGMKTHLDRPIFLVGCGKSGTTLLALLIASHPHVGPKPPILDGKTNLQSAIRQLLTSEGFAQIAPLTEQKEIWDNYFPMTADLRVGKELILTKNPLSKAETISLIRKLTYSFHAERYFNKAPFNSFRIHVLRQIWPDAKIIALHRDGRDVIASWYRQSYHLEKYKCREIALKTFAKKWNEAIDHLEAYRDELGISIWRYENLVDDPNQMLKKILSYAELPWRPELYDGLKLDTRCGRWQAIIPEEFHSRVNDWTNKNRERLGYV
ncbi:MAG: sulfotransferase [Planctomycetes bacterium]|nr:sulfotransferase [Planctomycetota bacterium]